MFCDKNVVFEVRMLLFLLKNEGYSPMHEVVPRVVAMAVRMVITKCRIF